MLGDIVDTRLQTVHKRVFIHHQLVGRRNDDIGIGIGTLNAHIGPSHTGCRVTIDRLHQDIMLREIGQLLAHQLVILLTGTDKYILERYYFRKPIESSLKLSATDSEKVDKLFGTLLTTAWP